MHIAVSACFMYPDPERKAFAPKSLSYLENDMAKYLCQHDARPIMVPDVDRVDMERYIKEADGLVLQGGLDVHPSSYGEEVRFDGDHYRDQYELFLVDCARKHKKPILGICRGCQVLNVAYGGTLHQDLETDREVSLQHRDAEAYDQISHDLEFVEGGLLQQIYGVTEVVVNSVHHQGIKDLGEGLRIEAFCPDDGLVEAVVAESGPLVLGVQWHPEFSHTLGEDVVDPEPLLKTFLEACRK